MAVKTSQLYNADFFSQVGTEYICTGFMFDAPEMESMDYQLTKGGDFMAGQVLTGMMGGVYSDGVEVKPGSGKWGALTGVAANVQGQTPQQKFKSLQPGLGKSGNYVAPTPSAGADAPGTGYMGGSKGGGSY